MQGYAQGRPDKKRRTLWGGGMGDGTAQLMATAAGGEDERLLDILKTVLLGVLVGRFWPEGPGEEEEGS